ncbi:MAG: hypothetical protein A2534_01620 [Candidatus Magasanikbacteria bacterium RIFOXYD2_FULL_39_9]|uniref:Cohesin domain-containing protein n=1 Tax=Candidatus Magasanikbacteria bacterium RIFOXYD1_FULL_40_23 TaxID=1798705 RepID=A0A1F6PAR9_9BACT|nr:MAG: hypothetical protein A2563_04625 [Candidatus Magasanikbacteria bacterium RIFOXYD1_FULL_40_23]OGH93575.1 MAG: hypothetical protein A2534_01620 [Candidatus Magasanikbacteria bacterium RIFOXYD2_FULL_39_9]
MEKKTRLLILIVILFAVMGLLPIKAKAASLVLRPGSGNFLVGGTFDLSIVLDTKHVSVNTIEAELLFPRDKIQLANNSIGKSIIQFWPAVPEFSNEQGRVYFAGAIPSPGVNISEGVVLTLTFRVISLGEAEIRFGDKTSVLANDGKGTNVLNQKPSAFFKFSLAPPQGPEVSSPTHPDQESWYKDSNPLFIWTKRQFSEGYSFEINQDPADLPDATIDTTEATASFQNLESGVWYFHIREKAGGVWGGASHYGIRIDSQAPAGFKIGVSPSNRTTNKSPIFRFFTTDALSGLDHFEIKLISLSSEEAAQALFFEATSPYQAINLKPGRYQVVVRALDTAKNTKDETVTITIVGSVSRFFSPEGVDLAFVFVPWGWVILGVGVLLLIVFLIILSIWVKHHHHLKSAFKEDINSVVSIFKKDKNKK